MMALRSALARTAMGLKDLWVCIQRQEDEARTVASLAQRVKKPKAASHSKMARTIEQAGARHKGHAKRRAMMDSFA